MADNWWDNPWALFDTETTGVDPLQDRIVSWSLIALHPATGEMSTRAGLISPGVTVPREASDVHGITDEVARRDGAPPHVSISELIELMERCVVRDIPIVAFNAAFDMTLLRAEARRHGVIRQDIWDVVRHAMVVDPLVIDKRFDKYRKGPRNLAALCERYGVALDDAHDAGADALATGLLLQEMLSVHDDIRVPLRQLHDQQVGWYRAQAVDFEKYLARVGKPRSIDKLWPLSDAG